MTHVCPICQCESFDMFNGREMARCISCGALERGRVAWLVMRELHLLRPGIRMLNMAPEPFMLTKAADIIGNGYVATDYSPELFAKWRHPVQRLNMCKDLNRMSPGTWDVVIHNHVLEHLPCDVRDVLKNINMLLAVGGVHLFSAPILPGRKTEEDLDMGLSPQERKARFGQEDHLRIFGDEDFMTLLGQAMPVENLVDLSALINPDMLRAAAVPENALTTLNPNHIFAWKKGL